MIALELALGFAVLVVTTWAMVRLESPVEAMKESARDQVVDAARERTKRAIVGWVGTGFVGTVLTAGATAVFAPPETVEALTSAITFSAAPDDPRTPEEIRIEEGRWSPPRDRAQHPKRFMRFGELVELLPVDVRDAVGAEDVPAMRRRVFEEAVRAGSVPGLPAPVSRTPQEMKWDRAEVEAWKVGS